MHTGETPHRCKYCPRSFYDSNGLKRHTRKHVWNKDLMGGVEPSEGIAVEAEDADPIVYEEEYFVSQATGDEIVVDESELITFYMNADDGEC